MNSNRTNEKKRAEMISQLLSSLGCSWTTKDGNLTPSRADSSMPPEKLAFPHNISYPSFSLSHGELDHGEDDNTTGDRRKAVQSKASSLMARKIVWERNDRSQHQQHQHQQHQHQQRGEGNHHRNNTSNPSQTQALLPQLQGPESISFSITERSLTVLLDVETSRLVPHSAEIDFLDPDHPLVMIFPAAPLRHNAHYAVAVLGATDQHGERLPRSHGLAAILRGMESPAYQPRTDSNSTDSTTDRYVRTLLPTLSKAVHWYDHEADPEALQLLFDFVTCSARSQLGALETVRDRTLKHIESDAWNWEAHVRVVAVEEHDGCEQQQQQQRRRRRKNNESESAEGGGGGEVARTVHLSLDVPSFLKRDSRYSVLDPRKLDGTVRPGIGTARAMVEIPCSVRNETIREGTGKPLRAVIDYGHGLFGNRGEAKDFRKLQNDYGYIMMAMDWRGMSRPDVPVVVRTLLGQPDLFEAVRDNLIQGFANKICLQHFARESMLGMEVLKFGGRSVPTLRGESPVFAYYGISQGGILGAGYLSATAGTHLIDRGILGSPGSPFALVLTRSLDFKAYDKLLLINYYHNRHVRIALALMQMGWDSVEASGWRAPSPAAAAAPAPATSRSGEDEEREHFLRPLLPPLLIQAGLGDPNVPTIAAETLARAMGASLLPSNPRSIFGLEREPERDALSSGDQLPPQSSGTAILSELWYETEYDALPIDNDYFGSTTTTDREWSSDNHVHWCLRWDPSMVEQVAEFVNTGRVIDPCAEDSCRRASCE